MQDTNIAERELYTEFVSFLLRYHQGIDYSDFSSNAEFVKYIRRYENVKYAAELE